MAKRTRSLGVLCPVCFDGEGVSLNLADIDKCECSACGESFDPRHAAEKFAAIAERWRAVAAWIDGAPTVRL